MAKAGVEDVLRYPRGGERGALYDWLRAHHDEFRAGLAKDRPDWKKLARQFGRMRLFNARGEVPTPEGARKTWQRVRGDVSLEQMHSLAFKKMIDDALHPERVAREFYARIKAGVDAQLDAAPVERVAESEAVRDLFRKAGTGRPKMPEPVERE